jgi:hypothetical protein
VSVTAGPRMRDGEGSLEWIKDRALARVTVHRNTLNTTNTARLIVEKKTQCKH